MCLAVVQHHELHHGSQTASLLIRGGNERGLHIRRDANADDFGFGNGQENSCVENASVLLRVSGLNLDATWIRLYKELRELQRLARSGRLSGASLAGVRLAVRSTSDRSRASTEQTPRSPGSGYRQCKAAYRVEISQFVRIRARRASVTPQSKRQLCSVSCTRHCAGGGYDGAH